MSLSTVTRLAPSARSASHARRIVEAAVAEAGLGQWLDEAVLLVTELVTNAVVHAGTELELHVKTDASTLRIEVVDRMPAVLPLIQYSPADAREGGRGIFLLDALATEWGTRHFGAGKSIWFCLGPGLPVGPRRPPSAYGADAGARRDISWLVGLPADLEEQLSSSRLISELFRRLVEALGLERAWLFFESAEDDRRWEAFAASDALIVAPDAVDVRRAVMSGSGRLLAPDPAGQLLPLRGHSAVAGAMVLDCAGDLAADDLALARLVGERISVVLRDARAQASQLRSRGSLALLAEASEMFAGTLDVQLAVTLTSNLVVPRFAGWSAVWTAFDPQPRLMTVAHADERELPRLRELLDSRDGQRFVAALMEEVVGGRPRRVAVDEAFPQLLPYAIGDLLAVPLVARRRMLGLLLVARQGGTYGIDDVSLLTDLGRRAALTIDNARLYEDRTSIAQALQASLLPPTLPRVVGMEFGARYAAAGEGNEVGGDFYDVFSVGDGRWALAIGDVCGKGAEAAAITGLARNVLRLLAREGAPPSASLRRLNEAILDLGERGRFCTAALALVEPDTNGLVVRMSVGGHPPPVLLRADGAATFTGRHGTVLGIMDDVEVVDDEVHLNPGEALVFYTDGVTERRHGQRMFGEHNLLECLRGAAGRSADYLAGQVEQDVRRFGPGAARDDLAVLVLRCAPIAAAIKQRAPASAPESVGSATAVLGE
jgi:phosphoserine phosphatase RsbU/P